MNIALWIAQFLLALTFLVVGAMKLFMPRERQIERAAYIEDFSPGAIQVIGMLEVLGAIGIILPVATGILPWLTPVAAVGLMLTMVGAALTHARRDEHRMTVVNVFNFALAAFVAYGRFV